MLIGYNPKNNNIEFLFSDTEYLNKVFPNNTAHITNFWKIVEHGLIEMFIDEKDFPDYRNYSFYKVIDGKLVKQENKIEVKKEKKTELKTKTLVFDSKVESKGIKRILGQRSLKNEYLQNK